MKKGKISFSEVKHSIKNFLFSKANKEFLVFLFFFFIASTFWLMKTLNSTYEYEFSVPLRMKNVPDKVVITSEIPNTVRFTVRDKGTVLLNYMFGQSFYPLALDWNDFSRKGTQFKVSSSELIKHIGGQLMVSSKVLNIKPDGLNVVSTVGEAKKMPVHLNARISMQPMNYLSRVELQPDSVLVYAPKTMLDTMIVAHTEDVQLQVKDSMTSKLALMKIAGVKYVPSSVSARFYVDVYSEKIIDVPVEGIDFPSNKQLKTFPPKVKVEFQVGLSHFKDISPSDFSVGVDYQELMRTNKCTVKLLTHPYGVKNIHIQPETVDYLIETH